MSNSRSDGKGAADRRPLPPIEIDFDTLVHRKPYRPSPAFHDCQRRRLAEARLYAECGYRDMVSRLWWRPASEPLPTEYVGDQVDDDPPLARSRAGGERKPWQGRQECELCGARGDVGWSGGSLVCFTCHFEDEAHPYSPKELVEHDGTVRESGQ